MGGLVGRVLGKYELVEHLGSGGMADVYRACQPGPERYVALKVLRSQLAQSEDFVNRFKREAQAVARLRHPHIVQLHDFDVANGMCYMVMELIEGGTLAIRLDGFAVQGQRIPLPQVTRILQAIASAVDEAHQEGIIHRDIKPSNIMFTDDDEPVLTDFGIARLVDGGQFTKSGAISGTVDYMSPEQIMGQGADGRSDVYSLGVVLYEMVTGQVPFAADTPSAVMVKHINEPPPPPRTLNPALSSVAEQVILRALAKSPAVRPQSAGQLAQEWMDAISLVSAADTLPAAALDTLPNLQATPLIGREAELAQLGGLLADPRVRLVTILGPGGIGKTRLALEVAAQFGKAKETFLVPLASLRAVEDIVPSIAQAAGYLFRSDQPPKQQLYDYLGQRQVLLVMDSFEHLLEGTGLIGELLQAAPRVQVLATSREPLNLREETRLRIGGLSYPEMGPAEGAIDLASCRGYGAVELFLQSARQVLPSLAPTEAALGCVARICQMVEGMPLAIILAAAWVETLSLKEIADEIGHSLDLLAVETRNMPVRHRSIRAVFDSTWNRMEDAERQALMRLSVFRGGFTRDAAQAVTGARLQTLRVLIEKSLVRRDQETGRFELHELLRHYAEEKLEASGTIAGVRDAHSEYYLSGPWQSGEHSLDVSGGWERLAQPLADPLTKRELEVLRLIAAGLSNQEIADQLVIGLSTVKKHINRAYSKLGVHRRTQAIVRAQALNLL